MLELRQAEPEVGRSMDSADSLEGEVGDDELEAVAHARDDGASRPKPECNEVGDDGVDLAVERAVGERPGAVDERDRRPVARARPANARIDGQADRHEPARAPVQPALEVLLVLRSRPQRRVHVTFELERCPQGRVGSDVQSELDHPQRRGRELRELRRELVHGRRESVWRNAAGGDTPDLGGRTVDPAAGHAEVLRAREPGEAQQALAAAAAGHLTERHLGEAERRRLGDDAEVARERELERASVAVTVDRGDHGLRNALGRRQGIVETRHRDGCHVRELAHVDSGRECALAGGLDDQDPQPLLLPEALYCGAELVAVGVLEDVELARGSQDDPGDAVVAALGDAEERAHAVEEPSTSRSCWSLDASLAA